MAEGTVRIKINRQFVQVPNRPISGRELIQIARKNNIYLGNDSAEIVSGIGMTFEAFEPIPVHTKQNQSFKIHSKQFARPAEVKPAVSESLERKETQPEETQAVLPTEPPSETLKKLVDKQQHIVSFQPPASHADESTPPPQSGSDILQNIVKEKQGDIKKKK